MCLLQKKKKFYFFLVLSIFSRTFIIIGLFSDIIEKGRYLFSHIPLFIPSYLFQFWAVKTIIHIEYFLSFLLFFFFFRAVSLAYGSSQASGPIGVVVASLCHSHSMRNLSWVCNLPCIMWQHQILNPLNEARIEHSSSWTLVGFLTH